MTVAEALQEFERAIRAELDHAILNGHRLDPECQGCATAFTGEPEPAVRIGHIEAALDALRARFV